MTKIFVYDGAMLVVAVVAASSQIGGSTRRASIILDGATSSYVEGGPQSSSFDPASLRTPNRESPCRCVGGGAEKLAGRDETLVKWDSHVLETMA